MSVFNATALIVDDRNVNVQYSPGWQQQSTTAEYDDTKSGADQAGMTATFQFTGMLSDDDCSGEWLMIDIQ